MVTIEHRQKANKLASEFEKSNTRSMEHMIGFRSALTWRVAGKLEGELDACPYKFGTCQAEAWINGKREGCEFNIDFDKPSTVDVPVNG